jgi:hypothetical protein
MKLFFGFFFVQIVFCSCQKQPPSSLEGTWELVSATSTEKDSTFSTFNSKVKMIKIINPSHFAFLSHDITNAKDSARVAYSAGGGTYTLIDDSLYTENLEYFIDPQWENHRFEFVIKIQNDTLVQKGVEKLEKLGIDRVIVEKYKKIK